MKISIIVPVYKVEGSLARCVDSILGQTHKDIEVVLVDDGSPDGCPALCDDYAARDERVRVIHKPNGGLSDARNAGLAVATGEYVMFVDSDDYVELDVCERFLPYLESGVDIAMGDCEVTKSGYAVSHYDGLTVGEYYLGREYMKSALARGRFPVVVWLNFYRREFLKENGLEFKRGIVHEDNEFSPRAFYLAKSVVYTAICFYHYIINDESITSAKDKRKNCADVYSTGVALCEWFSNIDDRRLYRLIMGSLASAYMTIYRAGRLYRYGKEFTHKGFVLKHAYKFKTKLKALLFAISPRLFCKL